MQPLQKTLTVFSTFALRHSRNFCMSSPRSGAAFLTDPVVELQEREAQKSFPFAVHELDFPACGKYYQAVAAAGSGHGRPLAGLRFNTAYVDTAPNASSATPTVMVLHGSPGSHLTFKELIEHLAAKGVRVIAPNFPGYGWTPTDTHHEFRHTQYEKAHFLKDFLNALKVQKVDMIVSHSSSVYPSLILCAVENMVGSLALVNPGNLQRNPVIRGRGFLKFVVATYRNPILRPLSLILLKLSLMAINFGNKNVHQMVIALETLLYVDFDDCRQNLLKLASQNFPVLMLYSINDAVVPLSHFEDYIRLLGRDLNAVIARDVAGQRKVETGDDAKADVHCFDSGGHFVMKKYPNIVNQLVYEFLVRNRKS